MGMMIQPIIEGEGGGKLTEDILCMKWDDYKKCGHKFDDRYTWRQENTVKVIEGNVTVLKT